MLLSNIPIEERKRRGYYAVGGCGGNTAWHTPDDRMPVADLKILERDLAVYLTTIVRILNAPLYPFDYAAAADEIRTVIEQYQSAAGGEVDFTSIVDGLAHLASELREWRSRAESRLLGAAKRDAERRRLNRILPLNYARGERFDHDPAVKFGAVPRLEAATGMNATSTELKPFLKVGLVREANKVRATIRGARELITST
jgi:N-acetylated-alpha-linked acidic dipeptidase